MPQSLSSYFDTLKKYRVGVCLRPARTLRSPHRKTLNYKAQVEVYGSQGGEKWLHRKII